MNNQPHIFEYNELTYKVTLTGNHPAGVLQANVFVSHTPTGVYHSDTFDLLLYTPRNRFILKAAEKEKRTLNKIDIVVDRSRCFW